MLGHELIRAGTKPAPETILFFHGMLGRRMNLRGFARRFVSERFQALLVDHRGHGDSGSDFPRPHTVDACVGDAGRLVDSLINDGKLVKSPRVIVGHSFGGKVSVAWRNVMDDASLTWVLDAAPGKVNPMLFEPDNKESVIRLMKELRVIPPWKTKADLSERLTDAGFSTMVSQWMTTNVITKSDGSSKFVFDLDIVDELFADYCQLDLFPTLAAHVPEKQIHFLRAGRNHAMWTDSVLERFQTDVDPACVHLHTMERAGHFLHAQDPAGVHSIMAQSINDLP